MLLVTAVTFLIFSNQNDMIFSENLDNVIAYVLVVLLDSKVGPTQLALYCKVLIMPQLML